MISFTKILLISALVLAAVSPAILSTPIKTGFKNLGTFKYSGRDGRILQSTYFVSTERGYWGTAKSACLGMNASLLSIESAEEDAVVRNLIKNESISFWTSGSYEDGSWKWDSTKQSMGYTNWKTSPIQNIGYRVYVMINSQDGSYGWFSYAMSTSRKYICEQTVMV